MFPTHADDMVRAYVALLSHAAARGVYNIIGWSGITSRSIAENIASKLGCSAKSVTLVELSKTGPFLAPVISVKCQGDSSKAQHELDWQPWHTSFSDII